MAAEAAAIVASSGVVGGVAQSTSLAAKSAMLQTRQWLDRMLGLKLLKKLPNGLEAQVYGDDVTPELLAALSLGGRPGHELSTLALLTTNYRVEDELTNMIRCPIFEYPPTKSIAPFRSRMDGSLHEMLLLDGQADRMMRLHTYSAHTTLSLDGNSRVVVVGYADYSPYGVVVRGSTDGRFYYCENRTGSMQCTSADTCPAGEQGIYATSTSKGSQVFTVAPGVLHSYPVFSRMCQLLINNNPGVVELLGLAEVARSLALHFAEKVAGGSGEKLLSQKHLRKVHHSVDRGSDLLQMPVNITDMAREAGNALPLFDRKYERTRFGETQKTTADLVEEIRSLAESTGNVGVRATVSQESCLIKSCVVGSLGMEPSFAIFQSFRRSRVNIAVSPGCTAIYFPGLHLTLAFPDGSAVEPRIRRFLPACPFTSDISEAFGILMDLAPIIGKGIMRKVALALSEELASDPSLVLGPVTENVVRSFGRSVDETPIQHSLTKLLGSSSLGEGRFHREAALAGVLCQLGLSFAACGGADMRCFFSCCRDMGWGTARGNVGVVVVDCKVDISGCHAYVLPQGVFLGGGGDPGYTYLARLTGPGLSSHGIKYSQPGANFHLETIDWDEAKSVYSAVHPNPFPFKCYVGSRRTSV